MTVGTVLRGPNKEEYAQPRIKYSMVANVRPQDGRVVVVEKEITILPRSEPGPPVQMSDFPNDFIVTTANSMRFSTFGPLYRMTVWMPEPSPISLKDPQDHIGEIQLDVDVRIAAREGGKPTLYRLSESLRNLNFSLQPVFRAKTFCSTKPFSQAPGQDMVRPEYGIHLHESILKLPEQCRHAHSWRQQFLSPANILDERCSSLLEAWTTHFRFPIKVTHIVAPTFCSATASRQYSIIGRVRVKGAQVQEFVLECPLQIYYLPSEGSRALAASESQGSHLHAPQLRCERPDERHRFSVSATARMQVTSG